MTSPLVSTQWLAEHLDAPDIRIADASWYLPDAGRSAKAEYQSAHIARAVFFDLEDLSDENNSLPHMLAPAAKFASRMRRMGLGDGNLIVVYDGAGLYSSPRAWWMLKAMGHEDVRVLDGGLPKWRREGRPVEDMAPPAYPRHFTPRQNHALLRNFEQMRKVQESGGQIVDARSPSRFAGREPEPRSGVRPGHIPGSVNVHYASLIAEDGTLKTADELREIFKNRGVDLSKPVVTSCGSGVTATIVMLGLAVAGASDVALYDGSWAEWGARGDAAVGVG
ncbi:MAG: 3-mercaptopyruvate sulfurtransferase [Alphaproteobacteria bacterium]|nr:3-mercaptopyruvate sulfurtransferase [Alphaproteobacteria bacterium]